MVLRELLMREGRAEVGVARPQERQGLRTGRRREAPVTGPPAASGHQPGRAGLFERLVQAPHLALAQSQPPRRPAPGEPPLGDSGQHL